MNELRPKTLNDFVGNEKIKSCIRIQILAAKKLHKSLPHTLISGIYGCGKSTIGWTIANELNRTLHYVNAASISEKKNIIQLLLKKIREHDIVFIDEIHRLDIVQQEILYPAMEDFKLSLPLSVSGSDRIQSSTSENIRKAFIEHPIRSFTLIGATTDIGLLSGPFLSRFSTQYFLDTYTQEEIKRIIELNCEKLKLNINREALEELARRSKNIPRIANGRLQFIRDYVIANDIVQIQSKHIIEAMEMLQIDEQGLDYNDRKYLVAVLSSSKPLGLTTLSSMTGLTEDTIRQTIEPYLIAIGLIAVGKSGRQLIGTNKFIEQTKRKYKTEFEQVAKDATDF